jgi:hypothetical protein
MPQIKKIIPTFSHIDLALKWVDAQSTKMINAGFEPFLILGYGGEESERNSQQNAKFHVMIGDIAKQAVFKTPVLTVAMADYDVDSVKALLVRWFEQECAQLGEPLRHGSRVVIDPFTGEQIAIRPSTAKFLKAETINFIEWLYATGSAGGVKWSEPALKEYANYKEAQK